MRATFLILACFLSGCGAQRMDGERSGATEHRLQVPVTLGTDPYTPGPGIKELREDVKTSHNAAQQAITGLGANVGKLGETFQAFGGDLARISLELHAAVQANIELKAQVSSLAQAQVGLRNEIQQLATSANAGRDAVNSTTQFSKEMATTIQMQGWGTVLVVVVMAGALITFLERSRRRAERRSYR